jgi:hypothetical protein
MGFDEGLGIWIDNRFRSAFALATHDFSNGGIAARVEGFDSRHKGSLMASESNENGWAVTLAGHREFGPLTGFVELLHVSSKRGYPEEAELAPRQRQTRLQAELRLRW